MLCKFQILLDILSPSVHTQMYMTHTLLSAEASSQGLSSEALQLVDQRIQHAIKVATHHAHSSPSLSMFTTGKLLFVRIICAG